MVTGLNGRTCGHANIIHISALIGDLDHYWCVALKKFNGSGGQVIDERELFSK